MLTEYETLMLQQASTMSENARAPAGKTVRQPATAKTPVRESTDRTANCPAMERSPSHGRLTPRQLEVLSLLCAGLPNKAIGRNLNISPSTVKVHIGHIFKQLGASSRLQAAVTAQRRGLLRASESRQ